MKINVAGDVCIDVVGVPKPRRSLDAGPETENWRQTGEIRTHHLPGGALLLEDMVRAAATGAEVRGPELVTPKDLSCGEKPGRLEARFYERLTRDEIVHSVIRAGEFKTSAKADKKDKTLRVALTNGFSGPAQGDPTMKVNSPKPDGAEVLVLDDTGNRFRREPSQWKELLEGSPRLIIHKLHRPLPQTDGGEDSLWHELEKNHRDRTVVVMSADDFRLSGAVASRQLSWERTARETLGSLVGSKEFEQLAKCRWLVIRFGLDGALCCHCPAEAAGKAEKINAWLIYDPAGIENQFAATIKGAMIGYGSAFTAALTAALCSAPDFPPKDTLIPALVSGVRRGLLAARELLKLGFGKPGGEPAFIPAYPVKDIFEIEEKSEAGFGCVAVPLPEAKDVTDPTGDWTILKTLLPGGEKLRKVVNSLALKKELPVELLTAPVGIFGKLATYDRKEIESYRAISNLMHEYLAAAAPKRPLCFAVFGPPGSGKSFGVQQVAEAVADDTVSLEKLVFNLSQFQSPEQLAPAFHLVRDSVLKGRVPLVFFDEFDSSVGGVPLFWLKYLLAPMQDGEFLDQGAVHPIGKAIVVFAGGTSETYESFMRPGANEPAAKNAGVDKLAAGNAGISPADSFRTAKGKDFVSRLRGYLNISGIELGEGYCGPALLRRAGILRYQLADKAPHLFDADETLSIDPGVLRAFLHVHKFEHGVRSLEALLDMSMLAGREHFDSGCLPSPDQLRLHVQPKQTEERGLGFLELVRDESPWPAQVRELIASAIHEHYLEERRKPDGGYNKEKPSHQEWTGLNEFYKDSNLAQADDIPRKLRCLGLDYVLETDVGERRIVNESDLAKPSSALAEKVDSAARSEHERWSAERRRQGWVLGEKEDATAKTHPDMKDWKDLDPRTKTKDLAAICGIPRYLKAGGYVVLDSPPQPPATAGKK